jgi:hypothetical protein
VHYGRVRAVWKTGHHGRVSIDMRTHNADGRIVLLGCQTDFAVFYHSLADSSVLGNAPW